MNDLSIYCIQCGAKNPMGNKFCIRCGAAIFAQSEVEQNIEGDSKNEAALESDCSPIEIGDNLESFSTFVPASPIAREASDASDASNHENASKMSNRRLLAIVISSIVILSACGGVAFGIIQNAQNSGASESDESTMEPLSSEADDKTLLSDAADSSAQLQGTSGAEDQAGASEGQVTADDQQNADHQMKEPSSSSGLSPTSTVDIEEVACDFAKTYWSNVSVASSNDGSYSSVQDWSTQCLRFIEPGTSLYTEMEIGTGAGFLDAEDICTYTTVLSSTDSTVRLEVGVAANRDNPVPGWSSITSYVYTFDVSINQQGKVTGFTSYYTDPASGVTYSASH